MEEHRHMPTDFSHTSHGKGRKFDRGRPLALMVMYDDDQNVVAEVRVCKDCMSMYYVMLDDEPREKHFVKEAAGYAS